MGTNHLNVSSEQTNLERFLDSTTPIVPSQSLSKSEIKKLNKLWHPWEKETMDYITLGDLWNGFGEMSYYGAGVPITTDDGRHLIQYFTPSLSALQIFTSNSSINYLREEMDSASGTRDSSSDSLSDESETEKFSRWDGSSSEEILSEPDSSWLPSERLGQLYCQYFERSSPYCRVPLIDKVSSLAQRYPGLMSLRNVDLSPASWMAIAWYPIYHVPTGRTVEDLKSCFLTYHTLSSSFQDTDYDEEVEKFGERIKEGESATTALPPFGLATYKMQGNVWISGKNGYDQERLESMLSVADSWLKQLRVQHHDFNYFMGARRVC